MFDNLYDDIGGKIKGWAKWIFIVEAIGAVIAGITMMANANDIDTLQFVMGIVTVVFGPLVAYVSSWLLYAFGQLVEDTSAIRRQNANLKNIEQSVQNISQHSTYVFNQKATNTPEKSVKCDANEKAESESKTKAKIERIEKHEHEIEKKAALTIPKEDSSLLEKLEYSLEFQSDDGMIKYLQSIQDETVQSILKYPPQSIREQIKMLIEDAKKKAVKNKWDRWNEEYSSFGQCEICKKKQFFFAFGGIRGL